VSTVSFREHLRALVAGAADLVWPRRCWLCERNVGGDALTGSLCGPCRADLAEDPSPTCPRCAGTVGPYADLTGGCPQCRGVPFRFDAAVRLGSYDGLLRQAVLRLKHAPGEPLAEELGGLLAEARRELLCAHKPDAIVPVPLYWWGRLRRGYNQSEAVARGVAVRLGVPCQPGWLVRTRATSQREQSAAARWENVRGAFRVRRGLRVPGARVLLIDDVLTTGATADAAAAALRQAGAAQVVVAILAGR
jgi:ComF family protein